MERTSKTDKGRCVIPMQVFNGKTYHRYAGERYFTRGAHKMHRDVWEYYHGTIQKGYHVHHIDEDTSHNDISNLELLDEQTHLSKHMQERMRQKGFREKIKQHLDYARGLASKWHASEAGHEWHVKHGKEVAANLKPKTFVCEYCGKEYDAFPPGNIISVLTNAKRLTAIILGLITKYVSAKSVEKNLSQINIQELNIAVEAVQEKLVQECKVTAIEIVKEDTSDTFDIEVEDTHEFFANGVLVHNCDASRYYLMGMVYGKIQKPKGDIAAAFAR